MFYSEVFDAFNRNSVRYLVVGGVAMNLHGVPVTVDEFTDVKRRTELLTSKNVVVLSFFKGAGQFDVVAIFVKNPVDVEDCCRRKKIYGSGGLEFTAVAPDDLIRLKSMTNRQQDAADIEALRKLPGS